MDLQPPEGTTVTENRGENINDPIETAGPAGVQAAGGNVGGASEGTTWMGGARLDGPGLGEGHEPSRQDVALRPQGHSQPPGCSHMWLWDRDWGRPPTRDTARLTHPSSAPCPGP